MNEIQYIGENLLPRQIGHAGIVLSFVAAILSMVAYFFATQNMLKTPSDMPNTVQRTPMEEGAAWQKIGRWAFATHGIAVMASIATLFYVMINKRFEYFYAHSHVDTELPFRYVFAAFWEGQEGSFLLWLFWHVGLGAFIILRGIWSRSAKLDQNGFTWENPVLAALACVQVFLSSMILGLHFGFGEHILKWGSNPILLLRETNNIPLFSQPDYVSKLANTAKGLNPLLQNYWMTIHPPTLFLGFAATTIPFCYAIAGLWTRRFTEWLKPALPWALFNAMILGTGILMGGAWAYEALSFNGYWAWDPVENMSLVPWIVLVAGLHTHLIAQATGHSIRATFLFYILSFLLILYSTFLTRSGILGDTSAHAFTEMGLEWQLVAFQGFFLVGGLFLFFKNWKDIPSHDKEESIRSREFWMFIGALVLILSVVLISFTTSIPVFNKILNFFSPSAKKWAAPVDVVGHYNQTQIWIGVFIGLLSAVSQFLRFKEFNFKNYQTTFFKHLAISGGLSVGFTLLLLGWIEASRNWQYILFLFAGVFTLISNLDYLVSYLRHNIKASGSAIAHVGFGCLVIGILASGVNKKWISSNRFAMEGLINFTEEQFGKNVLVMKDIPLYMNGYEVLYESDTSYLNRKDFTVKFRQKSKDLSQNVDSFVVHPYVLYDKKSGKIASTNPDTRHFWSYDVFTHIAALPPTEQDPEIAIEEERKLKYQTTELPIGTPTLIKNTLPKTPQYSVEIVGINSKPTHPKYKAEEKDIPLGLKLKIRRGQDTAYEAEPIVLLRDDNVYQLPTTVNPLGIRIKAEPEVFERLFLQNKDLPFKEYVFAQGETVKVGNHRISFESVNASPTVLNFQLEPNDLVFGAKFKVVTAGIIREVEPKYVIRGTQPIPLKDDIAELGLHFAISKIDPETKKIYLQIAEAAPTKLPISIAEDAPRTDYIVLEATINPGINLVWLGSILIMLGLGMAMVYRIKL